MLKKFFFSTIVLFLFQSLIWGSIKITVMPFVNKSSDYWDEEYGEKIAEYLYDYLDSIKIELSNPDDINDLIEEKYFEISKASTLNNAIEIAEQFNSDYVIIGKISKLTIVEAEEEGVIIEYSKSSQTAIAEVKITIIDVKKKERIHKFEVKGNAYIASVEIGELEGLTKGEEKDEEQLVDDALLQAAYQGFQCVEKFLFQKTFSASVIEINNKGFLINCGKNIGLKKGKSIILVRITGIKEKNGKYFYETKQLGNAKISKLSWDKSFCKGKIADIKVNDRVIIK